MLTPPSEYFSELLPFHLVVDGQLRGIQIGRLLARFVPNDWYHKPITDLIEVQRPVRSTLTVAELDKPERRLWICSTHGGVLLRGDWQMFDEYYYFLCTAWIPNLSELARLNLRLDDFPLHESASDHLLLIQQHEVALNEMRSLSERLRAQKDLAEQASKSKTNFLATMSHEIRTPMNGIIGMTEILLDNDMPESQEEIAQTIQLSAQHLLSIINDILDFARLEAGRMDINSTPARLEALAEDSVAICQAPATEKNITLNIEIDSALQGYFALDHTRVKQVLINLLGNAIKFTPPKGSVMLKISADADQLKFEVIDTGPGMTQDIAESMFEPFKQEDSGTTRQAPGTGLGLAISARIVETCKGTIGVTSAVGQGSTFWFVLPATPAEQQPTANSARIASTDTKVTGHILLVEDNMVNQQVALAHLRRMGLEVTVANNGHEALQQCSDNTFQLILMDCHMPEMDGWEATRLLRQRGLQTPIIALTADVLDDAKDACLESGMDDVMTKPVRRDALQQQVASWLQPAESVAPLFG